jgi:hypothetical protein
MNFLLLAINISKRLCIFGRPAYAGTSLNFKPYTTQTTRVTETLRHHYDVCDSRLKKFFEFVTFMAVEKLMHVAHCMFLPQ